ncbi:MAG: hypothetical protein V7723_02160 [Sneathiella sp.]|uniref:hypothetical protein n=1 Tax=Sneathiella sp. TaxID=1964365 RepID=UPI003002909B
MNFIRVTIVLILFLVPAQAFAEDVELEVSKKNCSRITKYVADADVDFKPGVDVHGKAVVPADLDGQQIKIPDTIFINLALPFKDLLNNYNPKLKNAEVYVGLIEYNISSGRMLYNGQELSDPALNAIARECQKRYQ